MGIVLFGLFGLSALLALTFWCACRLGDDGD